MMKSESTNHLLLSRDSCWPRCSLPLQPADPGGTGELAVAFFLRGNGRRNKKNELFSPSAAAAAQKEYALRFN